MGVSTRSCIKKNLAVSAIQRVFRKKVMQMCAVNDADPITLEKFNSDKKYFHIVTENGSIYKYDAEALAQYFQSTGNWNEPFTNKQLNTIEVLRLQRFLGSHCNIHIDLISMFRDPDYMNTRKFREQAFNDLDDICGELLQELLDLADDQDQTSQAFKNTCHERIFPEFDSIFSQMATSNEESAMTCILKYITTCKGDPRHRRHIGRKHMHILDFLFTKVVFYIR